MSDHDQSQYEVNFPTNPPYPGFTWPQPTVDDDGNEVIPERTWKFIRYQGTGDGRVAIWRLQTEVGEVFTQGPQGEKGPRGEQGPDGEEGPQGPEGPEGPEGPQGPLGLSGQEGQTGPAGPKGDTGDSRVNVVESLPPAGERGEMYMDQYNVVIITTGIS